MTDTKQSGGLWLWGTIISIVCCLLFFIGLAIWTSLGDVELVYDNYYEKDVVFDQQIKRVGRTQALDEKPLLNYDQDQQLLKIYLPHSIRDSQLSGNVLLFRPADLHQDRTFQLTLTGDSLQTIPLPNLDTGLWRIKLNWSSRGLEYYHEQSLMVKG